jgi:hypothetical protein
MDADYQIPEPVLFNPLKHHLGFQRDFVNFKVEESNVVIRDLIKVLKHLGTSVMDVYNGPIAVNNVCNEVEEWLKQKELLNREHFSYWTGKNMNDFRIISLSDGSQWTIKYYDNNKRFAHIFPARNSQHSFRVKANTLKSAILYIILIGKDFITVDDLNKVRSMLGLSPMKDNVDNKAVIEMIEILRTSV